MTERTFHTKTSSTIVEDTTTSEFRTKSGSTWGAWSVETTRIVKNGESRASYGYNTVGYNKLMSQGQFVRSTPYSDSTETWKSTGSSSYHRRYTAVGGVRTLTTEYRWRVNGANDTPRGNTFASTTVGDSEPLPVDYEAPTREAANAVLAAACRIREEQFDLLTQLAELSDLPKLITQFASVLTTIFTAVKRGKIKEKELLQLLDVPGYWLAYRYGIMPVILSIEQFITTMAEAETTKHYAKSVSTNVSVSTTIVDTQTGTYPDYTTFLHTNEQSVDIKGIARLYYRDGRPKMTSDLLVTAWEKVPLSFVVDWVLTVGDFLSARAAVAGSSDHDFAYGFLGVSTNKYERHSYANNYGREASVHWSWEVEYKQKLRQPIPMPKGISFSPSFTTQRKFDGFALSFKLLIKAYKGLIT